MASLTAEKTPLEGVIEPDPVDADASASHCVEPLIAVIRAVDSAGRSEFVKASRPSFEQLVVA